jgi:ABC-type branched-subunit amino acid transport system permease subunit/ABC-type branched-subunit amino acid transport system ATPase component
VIALVLSPEFILLGAITGLVYALLASGLVLIYRSTGIINFAFGELGALCAAVLAKLVIDLHWNFAAALAVAVLLGALLGAALELVVVRRLFRSSRVVLLVATIGASQLFFLIQLVLPLRTGDPRFPSPFDREVMVGSLLVSGKHFLAIAVVPAVVAMLAVFLTRTPQGIAIRAAADNPDAAELAGISAKRVSTLVWTLGGALAALTVVLYNPLRGVLAGVPQPALGPGLLLRALAAALIGRLVSLPWALAGGLAIGVVEALLFVNSSNPGAADAVLFALVLGLLLVRGASARDFRIDGFVPTPRTAPVPPSLRGHPLVRRLTVAGIGVPLLAAALLPFVFTGPDDIFLFSRVLIFALAAISVTVLVGWAGQLSLGHFAFVGLGAMVTGSLVGRGLSFPAALGYAMVAGAAAGLLVGAPALRLRGLFLAVTTLAFAIAASNWLFQLEILKGKSTSLTVPRSTVLGVDLTPQRSYYWFCLVLLVVVGAAVSHWRGTGIGRGLIAVRENEDRASSLTLSPALMKLGAFAFSAAIAGLAGGLLAGLRVSYADNSFGPELSLQLVAMVIIGGLGTVSGAILGAVYIVGLPTLFGDSAEIALLTSGAGLLVLLLYLPGGLISVVFRIRDALLGAWATRTTDTTVVAPAPPARTARTPTSPNGHRPDVDALEVRGVRVRLGGRVILPRVDLRIAHGETVGLIGANGAGKSTLMSALSGHLAVEAGRIEVYGTDVAAQPAHRRARLGVGRIFQDARLFGDLTVTESIQVALEARERSEFVPSLLSLPPSRRAERRKVSDAAELVTFLGLGRYAEHRIATLSTGSRRIVELACLMAQDARLLLLDEPTSGVAQREAEAFAPLIAEIRRELDATVVIIEHDIPLVTSMSDRLYCLAVGEVIAEGEPEAVRHDPAVIAAYLGTDERAIQRSGATSALSPAAGATA